MRYCAGPGLGSGLGSAARLAGYGELRRSGDQVARQTRPEDTPGQACAGRRGQTCSARQYWQLFGLPNLLSNLLS